MRIVAKNNSRLVLVLERGEEIIASLERLARTEKLKAAFFTGLGAASDVRAALYSVADRRYHWNDFGEQNFEIANLTGNIALKKGRPFVHAHIIRADARGRSWGGHLGRAVVSATAEIMLFKFKTPFKRRYDPKTGLWLLAGNSGGAD